MSSGIDYPLLSRKDKEHSISPDQGKAKGEKHKQFEVKIKRRDGKWNTTERTAMNVIFKLLLSSEPREVFTRAWVNLFTLASFLHSGALSIHSFSTTSCVFGLRRSLK